MAVTIESLHYQNGFTYRDCSMPLERQGLVYLCGRNGHGKSTPFEILQHVFFGTTSRGIKKDGIACMVPGTDGFFAEVVLRNPDGRWLIRQSREHSRYKTAVKVMKDVDGGWSSSWDDGACPKRMDDAQKLAGSLLGLQQHEFAGCMYLSQSSAHTLIEGTPGDKMKYIAQLFGLDVCDRMVVWLKARLKDAEKEAQDAPGLEAQLAELTEERLAYDVPTEEDQRVVESAIETAKARKRELRDIGLDAQKQLVTSEQLGTLERRRAEIGEVQPADELRLRVRRLSDKRDALRENLQAERQRQALSAQLDELPVTHHQLDELERQIGQVRDRIDQANARFEALGRRREAEQALADLPEQTESVQELHDAASMANERRIEAELALRSRKQEIAQLRCSVDACVDGTCPTCRQPLDARRLNDMLHEATGEAGELAEATDRATGAHDLALKMHRIGQERERHQAVLNEVAGGDIEQVRQTRDSLQTELRDLEKARRVSIERETLERQLVGIPVRDAAKLTERIERIGERVEGLSDEIDQASRAETLDRQIASIANVDAGNASRTARLAEEALELLEAADVGVRERAVRIELALDEYGRIEAEIGDVEGGLERLAGPRARVHVLGYALAATQKLKRKKLHQVVESIRDCLPRFASTMFSHEPNTRFIVSSDDESLDLIGRRQVDGMPVDIPVKAFSGGEKQRLSVALVFTLHALLHARKRPDLLILDEVDRGLDDVGIASLMSLVREVRERYGTVIMTSHRSQIAGAAFDRTWTVMKQNEESRLTIDGGNGC
jgi:DNA repair exonuclease SbcCD ATPase subunit